MAKKPSVLPGTKHLTVLHNVDRYPGEVERIAFHPKDERDFEVRLTVPQDHPFSPYLVLFASTDPSGLPRPSANLSADELITIGEQCIALGQRLTANYQAAQAAKEGRSGA
jgi:hypothetical protein